MRSFLAWAGAILIGLALGLASAWACQVWSPAWYTAHRDGWTISSAYGAPAQGPYMNLAASGRPFAPPANEIRFIVLDRDENGQPLSESCIYELAGENFPARHWSLTLYSRRGALIDNGDRAFSVDAARAARDGDGNWNVRLAPVRGQSVNWLSTRNAGRDFAVALRLYQPRRDVEGREADLPRLSTISCASGA